jgi:flagellar biosynthetic protein FliR
MQITFPSSLLIATLLLFTRVAAVIGFVPLPYMKNAAVPVKVILASLLCVMLLPLWLSRQGAWTPPDGAASLVFMILAEATFGVSMGVVVAWLCELFGLAAQLLGLQAGYGYASTIDPNTEADAGVLLVVAQLGGWLLFLAVGVDRYVFAALAHSIEAHPLGSLIVNPDSAAALIQFSGAILSTALRLALPVISLLLLVDLALAAFGRLHAQLQLLSMAFPAKMLLSLAVLGLVYRTMAIVFERAAAESSHVLMRLAGA